MCSFIRKVFEFECAFETLLNGTVREREKGGRDSYFRNERNSFDLQVKMMILVIKVSFQRVSPIFFKELGSLSSQDVVAEQLQVVLFVFSVNLGFELHRRIWL